MDRIKKVCVYKQQCYGGKTDNVTWGEPKLLTEFKSVKLAHQAVYDFGDFTHTWRCIMTELEGKQLHDDTPTLIRHEFGDKMKKWGYTFEMWEKGTFGSKESDKYPVFKLYYEVIR